MKIRTVAMTGVLSLAGLGLVGAGAHAVFTTTTTSSQTISAGTPSVDLYATGAVSAITGQPCANLADATYPAYQCNEITLPAAGPFGSSFTTGDQPVTVVNSGNISITGMSIGLAATAGYGNNLYNEVSICEFTPGTVIYWGTLNTMGSSYTLPGSPIAPNGTTTYDVDLFAGSGQVTGCGTSGGGSPVLGQGAVGQSITLTATVTYSE
jgi:hypothetical protein